MPRIDKATAIGVGVPLVSSVDTVWDHMHANPWAAFVAVLLCICIVGVVALHCTGSSDEADSEDAQEEGAENVCIGIAAEDEPPRKKRKKVCKRGGDRLWSGPEFAAKVIEHIEKGTELKDLFPKQVNAKLRERIAKLVKHGIPHSAS